MIWTWFWGCGGAGGRGDAALELLSRPAAFRAAEARERMGREEGAGGVRAEGGGNNNSITTIITDMIIIFFSFSFLLLFDDDDDD